MDLPKLIFHTQCKYGHSAQQVFTAAVLERELAAGTLNLFCADCKERWAPTVDERIRLRAFAKRHRRPVVLAD